MKSTLTAAIALAVCLIASSTQAEARTIATFDGKDAVRWQTVNDGVMGGRSKGGPSLTRDGTLRFAGTISLENNGGFSSIRTRPQDLQLGSYDGLALRVRGDGRTYKLALRTSGTSSWIAYWADFQTKKDTWTTVRIPWSKLAPTTFGRKLAGPKLKPSLVNSIGFMLYDKKSGPFMLEVDSIDAFKAGEKTAAKVNSTATKRGASIVDTAQAAGSFKTLLAAAKAAGLVEALSSSGPLTVFAPTDAAFAKLPKGTVASLLEPENKDALRTVLLHHVVRGDVSLPALLRTSELRGLSDQRLSVKRERGALRVGKATLATAEIRCENGVIHVIDRVLLPELRDLATVAVEARTFNTLVAAAKAAGLVDALTGNKALTVFAPTDEAFAKLPAGTVQTLLKPENRDALKRILLHHVVQGRIYADSAAAAGTAASLAQTELRFDYAGGLNVNGTRIVQPDIAARNGVIHVVDSVLLPPALRTQPKASQQDGRTRALSVIDQAINAGVPLYNDGNEEACCTLYELAATALLGMDNALFSKGLIAQLKAAIDSSEAAPEKAWVLRRALDEAIGELRSRSND